MASRHPTALGLPLRRIRAAAPLKQDVFVQEALRAVALRRIRAAAPLKLHELWPRRLAPVDPPPHPCGGPVEATRKIRRRSFTSSTLRRIRAAAPLKRGDLRGQPFDT